MYLPLLDVGEPFSPFAWIRDAMQAFVVYLSVFFTSACGGLLAQSTTPNANVPGANDGQYLIGVGIGDVTGYVTLCSCMRSGSNLCRTAQSWRLT